MKVFITGTTHGLGHALALKYCSQGCQVIGAARSDAPDDLASRENYAHHQVDLMKDEERRMLLDTVMADGPAPDVVILNAGAAFDDYSDSFSILEFRKNFDLNLSVNVEIMHFFLPYFSQRKGTFAVITSLSILREVRWRRVGYSASKAALDITVDNLSRHCRNSGIHFITFRVGGMTDKGYFLGTSYEAAADRIINKVASATSSCIVEFPFLAAFLTRVISLLPDSFFIKLMKR